MEDRSEEMSNLSLHTRLTDAIERITHLEMKTIYKVGFWTYSARYFIKYIIALVAVFKHFI